MKSIIVVNSHPIQYFAPLYRQLAAETDIELTVLYCSKNGVAAQLDEGFGVKVAWDIPLLQGYAYRFLKNYAVKPSVNSFWGLINPGILRLLFSRKRNIYGYMAGTVLPMCWLLLLVG